MEIGELRPLKEMAVKPESVFRMRFYPQDGVVPKDANDSSSDKYFVKNPKQHIGVFQYQINKYYFLNGKTVSSIVSVAKLRRYEIYIDE